MVLKIETLNQLLDDIAPTPELIAERKTDELLTRVGNMRVRLASFTGVQSDIQIALDGLARSHANLKKESSDRLDTVEDTLKAAVRKLIGFSDEVDNAAELVNTAVEVCDRQAEEIGVLQSKMQRVADVLTTHDGALKRMKSERLTLGHVIGIGVCFLLTANLAVNVFGDFRFQGRLTAVEQVLGR